MGLIDNYPQFSPKEFIRNCWHCHEEFIGSSPNARYCSARCQLDYYTDKTSDPNGCWLWTGNNRNKSYESIMTRIQGISRRIQSHAWIITHGGILEGMTVANTCTSINCINPKHLTLIPKHTKINKCLTCGSTYINSRNTKFCSRECYFEYHVDKTSDPNGCWLWAGACREIGGGIISFGKTNIIARRYAYELYKGEVCEDFDNLQVQYACGNSNCVNPDHLRTIEYDNGDHAIKLTDDDIIEIYLSDDSLVALTKKYNVNKHVINLIQTDKMRVNVTRNLTKPKRIRHRNSELNMDLILEIYNDDGDYAFISEKYNVSVRIVRRIKNGSSWKDVTNHVSEIDPDIIKCSKVGLTEKRIKDIYVSELTCAETARKYGVSWHVASNIKKGKNWRSITKDLIKPTKQTKGD